MPHKKVNNYEYSCINLIILHDTCRQFICKKPNDWQQLTLPDKDAEDLKFCNDDWIHWGTSCYKNVTDETKKVLVKDEQHCFY